MKLTDDEFTPPEIFEPCLRAIGSKEFAFDPSSHPQALVPAKTRVCLPDDGLSLDWSGEGIGWGQPPYSAPRPWIQRFAEHPGGFLCLLNGDYSTRIWEEVIWPNSLFVILLYRRVKHISPHRAIEDVQAKRPSALVAFDPWGVIQWDPVGLTELETMGKVV